MATLDSLPADQRAVLQLLLRQGKTYAELAVLLRIEAGAVRERAHAGIAALVGDDAGVGADERAEVADYLLSQQTAPELAATLEYLEGSSRGRAYAGAVSDALAPMARAGLPEIPEGEATATAPRARAPKASAASRPRAEPTGAGAAENVRVALADMFAGGARSPGALAVGFSLLIVTVLAIVVFSGGGDSGGSGDTATTPAQTTTGPVVPIAQANLRPPGGGSDTVGVAFIVRQGDRLALALQAQGLQASTQQSAYAVWLYNSPSRARFLGFIPTAVGTDGNLQNVSALDQEVSGFRELLLTREQSENPTRPGTIVLRGRITEPAAGATGATGPQGAT